MSHLACSTSDWMKWKFASCVQWSIFAKKRLASRPASQQANQRLVFEFEIESIRFRFKFGQRLCHNQIWPILVKSKRSNENQIIGIKFSVASRGTPFYYVESFCTKQFECYVTIYAIFVHIGIYDIGVNLIRNYNTLTKIRKKSPVAYMYETLPNMYDIRTYFRTYYVVLTSLGMI